MAAPMFDLVYTVTADGNVPVTKYRSKKTGLTVFIAQVEGPLVNGYFCLGKYHQFSRLWGGSIYVGSDLYNSGIRVVSPVGCFAGSFRPGSFRPCFLGGSFRP